MTITRIKAPPSEHTFTILPIKELLRRYVKSFGKGWIDPFGGENSPAELTNDLNPNKPTKYHMEAVEFCKQMNGEFEGVLVDPPYSPRQIKECYDGIGLRPDGNYTQVSFYWDVKREIAHKIKSGGYAITFGWNSSGFGRQLGFKIIEILLVNHSSNHNDTIVTVEQKLNRKLVEFTQIPLTEESDNSD